MALWSSAHCKIHVQMHIHRKESSHPSHVETLLSCTEYSPRDEECVAPLLFHLCLTLSCLLKLETDVAHWPCRVIHLQIPWLQRPESAGQHLGHISANVGILGGCSQDFRGPVPLPSNLKIVVHHKITMQIQTIFCSYKFRLLWHNRGHGHLCFSFVSS